METDEIKRRMASGEIYYENEDTFAEQAHYRDLLFNFNHTLPSDSETKAELLAQLLGAFGEGSYIEPPFAANWGKNTYIGKHTYANSNLTLVDDTRITIGDNCMIGPNCSLCTAGHPLSPAERLKGAQFNKPVTLENSVWLGSNVVVLPGVTIGENSVIGAGAVVTKDIPANVVAMGVPCQVVRSITDADI